MAERESEHGVLLRAARAAAAVLAWAALSGCATPLAGARANFELGRLEQAEASLRPDRVRPRDRVLFLMERGAIRQARGDHEGSSRDFIAAADLIEELETYSVARGAASLVVNDRVREFRGAPYERTLLHALTALNHLAVGHWENAAVESRRIIYSLAPEARGDYPECAFSRYVAGFGLEMIGDPSNAALQYRRAVELRPEAGISPAVHSAGGPAELVVFVLLGRAPTGYDRWPDGLAGDAPLWADIEVAGSGGARSVPLSDTAELAFTTAQRKLALQVAKTVTRVVIKDAIAEAVARSTDEEFLGALTRFVLIGLLEQPDVRRWETLPRWLQVARVPCPPDLSGYRIVIRTPDGRALRTADVATPLARRGSTYVSLYRDVPPIRY